LARFRNDTGSVLVSQEFGLLPPGEFDAPGYDREVHGVIPGCVWLDAPQQEAPEGEDEGNDASTQPPKPSGKRGKAAQQSEEATP
jgi:hypothetical protein